MSTVTPTVKSCPFDENIPWPTNNGDGTYTCQLGHKFSVTLVSQTANAINEEQSQQ